MDDDVGDGGRVDDDVEDFIGAKFGEDYRPGRGADADALSLVRDHGIYADGDAIWGRVGKFLEVLLSYAKAVLKEGLNEVRRAGCLGQRTRNVTSRV